MAENKEKISTSLSDRQLDETIAGTEPGRSDNALAQGEQLPSLPGDQEIERIAIKLGAPRLEQDTLPLDGE